MTSFVISDVPFQLSESTKTGQVINLVTVQAMCFFSIASLCGVKMINNATRIAFGSNEIIPKNDVKIRFEFADEAINSSCQ